MMMLSLRQLRCPRSSVLRVLVLLVVGVVALLFALPCACSAPDAPDAPDARAVTNGSRPCVADDYDALYTECSGGTRALVWWHRPGAEHECTGGVPLPPNVFGLPCDIQCGPGWFLPLGELACDSCPPGTFSLGGGVRIDRAWIPGEWDAALPFETFCTDTAGVRLDASANCTGWTVPHYSPGAAAPEFLSSGNTSDSQRSVLRLPVVLLVPGHVHFAYSVDAEQRFDFFTFEVDGVQHVAPVSATLGFVEVTLNLTLGFHELRWVYEKDFIFAEGEDAAFLSMVEVGGIRWADSECTPCPPGTANPSPRREACAPCPPDTAWDPANRSQCVPCAANEYAYSGALNCTVRAPCVPADYTAVYSGCTAPGGGGDPTRVRSYRWTEPVICNTSAIVLPPDEPVPCAPCNPGTARTGLSGGDASCVFCAAGEASPGGAGAACAACPAGTFAERATWLSTFDPGVGWPAGASTGCALDCASPGWRLLGDETDSGTGHGRYVDVWLQLGGVELVQAGSAVFNFTLECSSYCSLDFSDAVAPAPGGNSSAHGETVTYYFGVGKVVAVNLAVGIHNLTWTFHKSSWFDLDRVARARLHSIVVTGTADGGAANCTPCADGSVAPTAAAACAPCAPGTEADAGRTECTSCTGNTYNPDEGSACLPCGHGTTATADATDCGTGNCTYAAGDGRLYDLAPLMRADGEMYGPIYESDGHTYFLSVCTRTHHNHSCVDAAGVSIRSFACQITTNGYAVDLGREIAFYDLPAADVPAAADGRGVVIAYTRGTRGCGVERATNITLLCDPDSGAGAPAAADPLEVSCHYYFRWRSLYACPRCTEDDYTFAYLPCNEATGRARRVYFWRNNPRRCHGGVALPADDDVECGTSGLSCTEGYRADVPTNSCIACDLGTFSTGGRVLVDTWDSGGGGGGGALPTMFSTCESSPACAPWVPEGSASIVSGGSGNTSTSRSVLSLDAQFLPGGGAVTFAYRLRLAPGVARLEVTLDRAATPSLVLEDFVLARRTATVNIRDAGTHHIEWVFSQPGRAGGRYYHAEIEWVSVSGTRTASPLCHPCPAGTYAPAPAATVCLPCEAGSASTGAAAACTPCAGGQFALAGASECVAVAPCTPEDGAICTADAPGTCTAENATALATVLLLPGPRPCTGNGAGGANGTAGTAPCPACAPGALRSAGGVVCENCRPGLRRLEGACVFTPPGMRAIREARFFEPGVPGPSSWPHGWATGCEGACGSRGWRLMGSHADSGDHTFSTAASTDSWVSLTLEFIDSGAVAFRWVLFGGVGDRSVPAEFWVDDVPIVSDAHPASTRVVWTFPAGNHTLLWNLHIEGGRTRSLALNRVGITDVRVNGTAADVNATEYVVDCPAGTESAFGYLCRECPAGMQAPTAGTGKCTACPRGTFASAPGSTQCVPCPRGTSADMEGASRCSTDCIFSTFPNEAASSLAQEYNVTTMPFVSAPLTLHSGTQGALLFSPCAPFGAAAGACAGSIACVVAAGASNMSAGRTLEFQPTVDSSGSTFLLRATEGDVGLSTEAVFTCDTKFPADLAPATVAVSFEDRVALYIRGAVGCPMCVAPRDYDVVLGPCIEGVRVTAYSRVVECNGRSAYTETETCKVESRLSLVWVAVIAAAIAVPLLGIVAFVIWRNRRVTLRYTRLLDQTGGRVELDVVDDDAPAPSAYDDL